MLSEDGAMGVSNGLINLAWRVYGLCVLFSVPDTVRFECVYLSIVFRGYQHETKRLSCSDRVVPMLVTVWLKPAWGNQLHRYIHYSTTRAR